MNGEITKASGPALNLIRFLLNSGIRNLFCIFLPAPSLHSDENVSPFMLIYKDGVIRRRIVFPIRMSKNIFLDEQRKGRIVRIAVRNVVSVLYFLLLLRERIDICVSVDSLNTLCALLFRLLRKINGVIYYIVDYSPRRFGNQIVNGLYLISDRIASNYSDFVWNLSPRMVEIKEKLGLVAHDQLRKQRIVPVGVDRLEITHLETSDSNNDVNFVYVGALDPQCGVDLVIEGIPNILKNINIKSLKFHIVGEGMSEQYLKLLVKNMGLESMVEFHGFLKDDRLADLLLRCKFGVAPYKWHPNTTKVFTDVTKPKLYISYHLPVIISNITPVANEIHGFCGIAVHPCVKCFADAITKLILNSDLYKLYKQNTRYFIDKYSWDSIFSTELSFILRNKELLARLSKRSQVS